MLILVSAIATLSEIIQFGVTADIFNGGYWLRTIIFNASAVVVLFLANSMRKDKLMSEKDTIFAQRKSVLQKAFNDMDEHDLTDEFKKYINEDNQKEKIRVYTNKLNARLNRLNNAILRAEHNYNVFRLWRKKTPVETPKTLGLILLRNKKQRVENKLSNCERDIRFIYVKYTKIQYSVIFGESEKAHGEERDILFHTTAHNIGIVFKKAIFVLIFGSLSLMQVGELIANFNLFTVYQMCMRIFTLALSVYTGISDADYFVGKYMADVLFRRISYIQEFLMSRKNKE
jgi:hypothetical protein